jgi:ribulose-5-phosphate 4-epimerase/fuculose-1-phosphate aldolase
MAKMDPALVDDLLTSLRILETNGIIDFNGHVSVRYDVGCLINSGGSVRSALTCNDIVATDADGRLIDGADAPPMEIHIHTEIYRVRPEVRAVVHGHPFWSTMLSSTDTPYRPVFPQGALLPALPVFPSPLSINTPEVGNAVAKAMGDGSAMLLQSHGVITAGPDLRTATVLSLYLEENARRQCRAAALGVPYVLSDEEVAACRKNLDKPNLFAKAWDYFAAKIARGGYGLSAG